MDYMGLIIGQGTDDELGEYDIYYNGRGNEVAVAVRKGVNKGYQVYLTGIIPQSRSDAMEQLLAKQAAGSKKLAKMKLYGTVEQFRTEEEEMLQLRAESKRWAEFVGTPTVDELIEMLQRVKAQAPGSGDWQCHCCGTEFYLHLDAKSKHVIFDVELLWEEHETREYWDRYY